MIEIINNSQYSEVFEKWKNAKTIKTSIEEPMEVYYVHHGANVIYIDPFVKVNRISKE